jgi:hypothetical protein
MYFVLREMIGSGRFSASINTVMLLRILFLFFFFSSLATSPAVEGGRADMRKPARIQDPPEEKKPASPKTPSKPSPSPIAETPKSSGPQLVPPVASPRAEEVEPSLTLAKSGEGAHLAYYGHAFVYLTSRSGVRVAMNPYTEGSVSYPFPKNLIADIVLISSEVSDHSGGQHLFGVPQIFRSLTGLGANRANGLPFKGVETYRDDGNGWAAFLSPRHLGASSDF